MGYSNDDLVDTDYTVPNTESPVETLARVFPSKSNLDNLTLWEQQQVEKGLSPTSAPAPVVNAPAPVVNTQGAVVNPAATSNPSVLNNSVLANQAQQATSGANRVTEAAGLSKYIDQDYVAPDLTNEDFFPGKNLPIVVGNVSSKTLGSSALIVPTGQYMPYSLIAKREAALDKAKAARKARQSTYKDPTTADVVSPKYNETFQRAYLEGINTVKDKAKAQYGDYAIDALQDPTSDVYKEMQQHQADYNYLGAKSNELINNATKIIQETESGNTTTYSKGQIETARSLLNTDQFNFNTRDLVQKGKKMEGYNSIEDGLLKVKYFEHLTESIKSTITPGKEFLTETQKKDWREQVKLQAETMKRDKYSAFPDVTTEMIEDVIYAKVPQLGQTTKDTKVITKESVSQTKAKTEQQYANERAIDLDNLVFKPYDSRGVLKPEAKQNVAKLNGKADIDGNVIQEPRYIKKGSYNNYGKFGGLAKKILDAEKASGKEIDFEQTMINDINETNTSRYESQGIAINPELVKIERGSKPNTIKIIGASGSEKEFSVTDENGIRDEIMVLNNGGNRDILNSNNTDVIYLSVANSAKGTSDKKFLPTKDHSTGTYLNGFLNVSSAEDREVDYNAARAEAEKNGLWSEGGKPASTPKKAATPVAKTPAEERTNKLNKAINSSPDEYQKILKNNGGDKAKAREFIWNQIKNQ